MFLELHFSFGVSHADISSAFLMQICTPWQAAVASVHPFPHIADLVATVNALADEAGEPSASMFQATAAYESAGLQGKMQLQFWLRSHTAWLW